MWTTVYLASGKKKAETIERISREEGFYVKIKNCGKDGKHDMFEIITLTSEAEELYQFLLEENLI